MKKLKGNIVIDLEDYQYLDYLPVEINSSIYKDTYNICFSVRHGESFKDIVSNPENAKILIKDCYEKIKDTEDLKEQQKLYKRYLKMMKKGIDMVAACSSYSILGPDEIVVAYLEENPELAEKIFYLPGCYELTWEDYEKAYCLYGKYPNARFLVDNNKHGRISLDEYRRTLELIDEVVNKVNSYSFSNLEKIMYVYDYVRDRYYVSEFEDEDAYVSRGITHVLLGNKVVCEGFVNLFNIVLKRLNISCAEFVLEAEESKHARSLVYVCDAKYSVCGLYMFDPTFDCKKEEGVNHMLRYKYFAKTPKQMMSYDNGVFEYESYPYFDEFRLEELTDEVSGAKMNYQYLCNTELFYYINYLMDLINEEKLKERTSYETDYIFNKMYYVNSIANEVIDCEKFAKLLYNVRRVQYLEDPIKFTKDVRMLSVILSRSELPYPLKDQHDKLLQEVCGYKSISVADSLYCVVSNVLQNEFVPIEEKTVILNKIKRS